MTREPQQQPQDASGEEVPTVGRSFGHLPVMLGEVVGLLEGTPPGVIVDATLGGGGHAEALLRASGEHRLVGFDRDPAAIAAASATLAPFGARAVLRHSRFDRFDEVLAAEAPGEPISFVLFDLGVSSHQLDEPGRGFSYRFDAPLDMRMDPADRLSAADIVNGWDVRQLAALFAEHGEGRFAGLIARTIAGARPIVSTSQLAELVRDAIPARARAKGGHPAKRVFQALRVAVNDELETLGPTIDSALSALSPGGRCVVLSYHSGEDRIVKDRFARAASGWCTCPPGLPCVCGAVPAVRVLTRGARLPSKDEVAENPRAASARLRAAERLDAPFDLDRAARSARGQTRPERATRRKGNR
jgi:16S rRNA (cytosine1402-N4)-methyltransferase